MGLDMFLTARKFIGSYTNKDEAERIRNEYGKGLESFDIDNVEIEFTVAYWRKDNHIHNWFVNNVQDGEDDCKSYYVGEDDMQRLIDDCNTVLKDKSLAEDILPCVKGFFFGSQGYGDYYFDSLRITIDILTKCLEVNGEYDFYYQSSW